MDIFLVMHVCVETETNECFKSCLYFKCSQAIVKRKLIKKATELLWPTGTHA